jgi:hypothetical protein
LIKQTGFLRKKIMKHEGVAVANEQQWAVWIGRYCGARSFVADRPDRDFFRLRLLHIGSCEIAKVTFDRDVFPLRCEILPRLSGDFLLNLILDRLCCENTSQTGPVRVGLAKNRAVLVGPILDKDW